MYARSSIHVHKIKYMMATEGEIVIFEQHKELWRTAPQRRGHIARSKPTQADLEREFHPNPDLKGEKVWPTVLAHVHSPCTVPLKDLEPITIDQLLLETVHRGRVLDVCTFARPQHTGCFLVAVKDDFGGVDRLSIAMCAFDAQTAADLTTRQRLMIKEPYYKVALDGGYTIQVDHPSDLVMVHDTEPATDARRIKTIGNELYQKQHFNGAIAAYTRALQHAREDGLRSVLLRNRAAANMSAGRYESALADATAAVTDNAEDDNDMAHFRAAQAAYALGDFSEAAIHIQKSLRLVPQDEDNHALLQRIVKRRMEEKTGNFDFTAMGKAALAKKGPLDHASFTANTQIKRGDTGRGLFATKSMSPGDLIMCEKAFCLASRDDKPREGSDLVMDIPQQSIVSGTHAIRVYKVVQDLLHSPERARKFYELCDSNQLPRPKIAPIDGLVPVDVFAVISRLELNGFSCPPNATCMPDGEEDGESSSGVWLTASAINHDCIGNASRSFIRDMLILRATKHIAEGEEILMRYTNPDNGIDGFQETLRKIWTFTCDCELCEAEIQVPGYQRNIRGNAVNHVFKIMEDNRVTKEQPPTTSTIQEVEKLRENIARTYSPRLFGTLPQPALSMISLWLCMAYTLLGPPEKALEWALAVLRNLGVEIEVVDDTLEIDRFQGRPDVSGIYAAVYAAASYKQQGKTKLAASMVLYASELHLVVMGSMYGFEKNFLRAP